MRFMQRDTAPAPPGGERSLRPLQAVFFDVGGTVLQVRPSVGHVYAAAAEKLGYPVDPDQINRAFRQAWKRSLLRRREAEYVTSDEVLRDEWRIIVGESFDGLLPGEAARRAFEDLFEHFAGPEPWSLAPRALETFRTLKAEGLVLGVLSNWDSRLTSILATLGVLDFFDHLVISHAVKVEKPHPLIFEEAARSAGRDRAGLLMVGDSWEQDIAPALALGWRAVWLHPGDEPLSPDQRRVMGRQVELAKRFGEVLEKIRVLSGAPGR